MGSLGAAYRDIMRTLDVAAIRRLWADIMPHLYQPKSDDEALRMLHEARVQSAAMTNREKAYSMAWLLERDGEPAETIAAPAVFCASQTRDPGMKEAVQGAMARVAEAALTQGMDPYKDAAEIQRAMLDARAKVKAGRISV